jgi:hypothetical protein
VESDQPIHATSVDICAAKTQRDQALACAVLAFIISLAVILSNFGNVPPQYRQTLTSIEQHKALVAQHEVILHANQDALTQNQAELERLRQAARARHP